MKKLLFICTLLFLSVSCREIESDKGEAPYYRVSQDVYSTQGVDSVETKLWYSESGYLYKTVYSSKDALESQSQKKREAEAFEKTHRENNQPFD